MCTQEFVANLASELSLRERDVEMLASLAVALFAVHVSPGVDAKQLHLPGTTLCDTRISGPTGSCHILYVRPALSKETCLYLSLNGRGTRALARQATAAMAQAFERSDCDCGACIVSMTDSKGASLLSLPIVAQFILNNRRQLGHIVVLEAKGQAFAALQVVKRLSSHDRIRLYRSLAHFASSARAGEAEPSARRDKMALQLAKRAARASTSPKRLQTTLESVWKAMTSPSAAREAGTG